MTDKPNPSSKQQTLTIQEALNLAVRHHSAGELSEAESIYRQILQTEPNQVEALHLLGVTAHQRGENDRAVDLIEKAIAFKPDFAEAHSNLGLALQELGRLDDAIASYRLALDLNPNYAEAHNNLSIALWKLDNLDEAVASSRNAIALKPDFPDAHNNLGIALQELGRLKDATDCFRKALDLRPEFAIAHYNLGRAFMDLEKPEEAILNFEMAIQIDPNYIDAYNNIGNVLERIEKQEEAVANYQKALAINPDNTLARNNLGLVLFDLGRMEEALVNFTMILEKEPNRQNLNSQLGYVLNALGRYEEALFHFNKNMELLRDIRLNDPKDQTGASISEARIKHDIEQFKYLASQKFEGNEDFTKLANLYATLVSEIDWPSENHIPVVLTKDQRQRIRSSFSIPLNLAPADRVLGSTLNESLNISEITTSYKENSPNLVVIDNFLTPLALSKLQRFLLESTIWFHYKSNGYIGAQFNDGLACPLLLAIAEDLRRTFSAIFKNYKLTRLWAYKYDSQRPGINVHADDAAINVNFWVKPNSANLDPDSGGLVLYHKAAPEDWPYDVNYTGENTDHIERYLEAQNSDKTIIPYAENRAVIFNSSLFHETDIIKFKPGYENRRISITLLFGRRPSRRISKRLPILNNMRE